MRSLLVFLTILGPVLCNPNFNGTIYQSRIPAYGNVEQGNLRLHPRQGCDLGYSLCAGTGPVLSQFKCQMAFGVVRSGASAALMEVVWFQRVNVVHLEHAPLDTFAVMATSVVKLGPGRLPPSRSLLERFQFLPVQPNVLRTRVVPTQPTYTVSVIRGLRSFTEIAWDGGVESLVNCLTLCPYMGTYAVSSPRQVLLTHSRRTRCRLGCRDRDHRRNFTRKYVSPCKRI